MKKILLLLLISSSCFAAESADIVYWDSPAGKELRSRIAATADYWQLIPNFAVQSTQTYCSVASAITVLNSLPVKKPVDPAYTPYAYFTQNNFFSPEVAKFISPRAVLETGMTLQQMAASLGLEGVKAEAISGDTLSDESLRQLLKKTLLDDGSFVLANYLRSIFGQVGGGHWSVLAAYDEKTDRVLILDVAKYKYPPVWVTVADLRRAISTVDSESGKSRGLVRVGVKQISDR